MDSDLPEYLASPVFEVGIKLSVLFPLLSHVIRIENNHEPSA